tara:strand:+ start:283 stop:987 length:705 start_codon:yes stop_codon:yes gene_type:complete
MKTIPAQERKPSIIMRTIPAHESMEPDTLCGQFAFGLEFNLSDTPVMDKLWEYISNAKENPKSFNATLAGNISSSLLLDDKDNWFFINTLVPIIGEYKEIFKTATSYANQTIFKNSVPYSLLKFWVNFQKQHEFNPLHNHSGVYSFVIFMKIPYDWKEQHELPFAKASNNPRASDFEFAYINVMGKIVPYTYNLDTSHEGLMLFFPAELYHQVYPFYNSEEERITISGNIVYDI